MRFAIRPAGDAGTIDPRPILESWRALNAATHPRGARGGAGLIGATAEDVFLLSGDELRRAVLSDPGIGLDACARTDVATGTVDRRVLAALAFLSRSGLKPTVAGLACAPEPHGRRTSATGRRRASAVQITHVNSIAVAGHQGAGTITDLTIRTLLTIQGKAAPERIVSLMRYPGAPTTEASARRADSIEIGPQQLPLPPSPAAGTRAAHSAATGRTAAAPAPGVLSPQLSFSEWNSLIARAGALPVPTISRRPSSAAIRDPRGTLVMGGPRPAPAETGR
jgi:hypothetical protein